MASRTFTIDFFLMLVGIVLLQVGCVGRAGVAPVPPPLPPPTPPTLVTSHLELPLVIRFDELVNTINQDDAYKTGTVGSGTWTRVADWRADVQPSATFLVTDMTVDYGGGCTAAVTYVGAKVTYTWTPLGEIQFSCAAHFSKFSASNCTFPGALEKQFTLGLDAVVKHKVQQRLNDEAAKVRQALDAAWASIQGPFPVDDASTFGAPMVLRIRPEQPYLTTIGAGAGGGLSFCLGMSAHPVVSIGDPGATLVPLGTPQVKSGTGGNFLLEVVCNLSRSAINATLARNLVGTRVGDKCKPVCVTSARLIGSGPNYLISMDVRTWLGTGTVCLSGREHYDPHSWRLEIADLGIFTTGVATATTAEIMEYARVYFDRWQSIASGADSMRQKLVAGIEAQLPHPVTAQVSSLEPILSSGQLFFGDTDFVTTHFRVAGSLQQK